MSVPAPLGSSADDPLAKPLHVQKIEAALRLDTLLSYTERILNDTEYRYQFVRFFPTDHFVEQIINDCAFKQEVNFEHFLLNFFLFIVGISD